MSEIQSVNQPLTPAQTALVLSVASAVLFEYSDKKGTSCSVLTTIFRLYACTRAVIGSERHEALCRPAQGAPDAGEATVRSAAPDFKVPSEASVHRRHDTDHDQLRAEWGRLKQQQGDAAHFPTEFIERFIPRAIWPVLVAMAEDGPSVFAHRIQRVLECERDRPARQTKRNDQGSTLSQSQLNSQRTIALRIAKAFTRLSVLESHPAHAVLSRWTSVPTIAGAVSHAGPEGSHAHGAVPRHLARQTFARLDEAVRDRLGMGPEGDDEIAAIRRLAAEGGRGWTSNGLAHALAARAVFALLFVVGPRIDSLTQLKQRDVVERYRHPEGISPAIYITPGKTEAGQQGRWKPIPFDLYQRALEPYRVFCELALGGLSESDHFFWSRKGLFTGEAKRWSVQGITNWLSGRPAKADRAGVPALIPVDPESPFVGFTAHSYRRAAKIACSSAVAGEWCVDNGVDPDRRDAIGEALLSHQPQNEMSALYQDDLTVHGRERLTWWGTNIAWVVLSTPLGARRVPDVAAYKAALTAEEALRADRTELHRSFLEVCEGAEATGQDIPVALASATTLRIARIQEELDIARETIAAIERRDSERMLMLSDDIPDDEVPRVDLRAIKREFVSKSLGGDRRELRPVRNWLTMEEFARWLGAGSSTVRTWFTDGLPASKDIWDRQNPPTFEFNSRRRAIHADGIATHLLSTEERRTALAQLLAQDPPEGWESYPLMVPRPTVAAGVT